jgi:hypothetical protein
VTRPRLPRRRFICSECCSGAIARIDVGKRWAPLGCLSCGNAWADGRRLDAEALEAVTTYADLADIRAALRAVA